MEQKPAEPTTGLPPLFAAAKAAEAERAKTPTNKMLKPETIAAINRQFQQHVDHIQRRDRAWDDALAGR